MRALEKAVQQSSHTTNPQRPAALGGDLGFDELATTIQYRSNSILSGSSSDVSNCVSTSNVGNDGLPQPSPPLTVPGLELCQKSVDVPELPDTIGIFFQSNTTTDRYSE